MKILLADDDALSRRLLQKTLERAGYDVVAVENGRLAAERLCSADGPRLALLDWVMPELDGPGVCQTVRRQREQPYVHMVLLTSKESKEDIVTGLESGADDYLVKPCDPEELKARLRTGQRILLLEDKLVEAREEMRFKATHDALTSLLNRGTILDLIERELQRSHREKTGLSLLLCDVDHFKKVNDTYGHLVGDDVLREVAKRLSVGVRNYDVVSRYGGEEFLIMLVGCDTKRSCERAEQIRESLAKYPVETRSGSIPVTMSVGVLVSSDWSLLDRDGLIREADAALYKAKEEGRNMVVLAGPHGLDPVTPHATAEPKPVA